MLKLTVNFDTNFSWYCPNRIRSESIYWLMKHYRHYFTYLGNNLILCFFCCPVFLLWIYRGSNIYFWWREKISFPHSLFLFTLARALLAFFVVSNFFFHIIFLCALTHIHTEDIYNASLKLCQLRVHPHSTGAVVVSLSCSLSCY